MFSSQELQGFPIIHLQHCKLQIIIIPYKDYSVFWVNFQLLFVKIFHCELLWLPVNICSETKQKKDITAKIIPKTSIYSIDCTKMRLSPTYILKEPASKYFQKSPAMGSFYNTKSDMKDTTMENYV